MYKKLTAEEYYNEVLPPLKIIFGSIPPDPFLKPFTNSIDCKRILFEYNFIPNSEFLKGLQFSVQREYLEETFYLAIVEGLDSIESIPLEVWKISFNSYNDFLINEHTYSIALENVIFSLNGNWGIISSHESHGVIGGSEQFINTLKDMLPMLDFQVIQFLNYWKSYHEDFGVNIDWLPTLMEHVYGMETAQKMLKENGY